MFLYKALLRGLLSKALYVLSEGVMIHDAVKELLVHAHYPAVSVVVALDKGMPGAAHNITKITSAIKDAVEQVRVRCSDALAKACEKNLLQAADEFNPAHPYDGYILYATDSYSKGYQVSGSVISEVVIGTTFAVRPLLQADEVMPRYYVLTLGQKYAGLYKGHGKTFEEIVEPEVDELGNPKDGFPFSNSGPSEHKSLALATGDLDSRYKDDHKKMYLRKVDGLLNKFLHALPLPLFVVGTEETRSMFRQITKHEQYLAGEIEGQFEHLTVHDLAERVWPYVEVFIAHQKQSKFAEFERSLNTDNHAFSLREVWLRAQEGRIKDLLVGYDFIVLGLVDPENSQHLIVYEKDTKEAPLENLVDHVIALVIQNGGNVFCFDAKILQQYESIAAVLRY